MREVLTNGGVEEGKVIYLGAHGTSTHLNDKVETLIIKRVFGGHGSCLAFRTYDR